MSLAGVTVLVHYLFFVSTPWLGAGSGNTALFCFWIPQYLLYLIRTRSLALSVLIGGGLLLLTVSLFTYLYSGTHSESSTIGIPLTFYPVMSAGLIALLQAVERSVMNAARKRRLP